MSRRATTVTLLGSTVIASCVVVIAAGPGCSGSSVVAPDSTPDPRRGPTAMDPTWGVVTREGPAVRGTSLGRSSVNGTMGELWDTDGDGDADEVDVDGDGIADGEDIDGDGVITIWEDLEPPGDDTSSVQEMGIDPTVQDQPPIEVERALAMMSPLPGEERLPMASTPPAVGGVNLLNGMVQTGASNAAYLRARNQSGIGSCSTFADAAAVAILRYNALVARGMTGVDINTLWSSPLYVYQRQSGWTAGPPMPGRVVNAPDGAVIDTNGSCGGTSVQYNINNHYMKDGVPDESEVPYPPLPVTDRREYCTDPTPAMGVDLAVNSPTAGLNRVGGIQRIAGTGAEFRAGVRRALNLGHPVVIGIAFACAGWTRGSCATQPDGTCRAINPVTDVCTATGRTAGGHGMVITAYDDTRNAYRVLNSWGTDYGDHGYLWWGYTALEGALDAGYEVIPLPPNAPPLTPPNISTFTATVPAGATPVYGVMGLATLGPNKGWGIYVPVQVNNAATFSNIRVTVDGTVYDPQQDAGWRNFDLNGTVTITTAGRIAAVLSNRSLGWDNPNPNFSPCSLTGTNVSVTALATLRNGTSREVTFGPWRLPSPTMPAASTTPGGDAGTIQADCGTGAGS